MMADMSEEDINKLSNRFFFLLFFYRPKHIYFIRENVFIREIMKKITTSC